MNEPRGSSLLVYLMALFILLAFVLAFTLVVTAGPFSDPSDNFHANVATMRGNAAEISAQCLVSSESSVQETCPDRPDNSIFWDNLVDQ